MSSRRNLPCHAVGHSCVVGYDRPFSSYFAEVRRGRKSVLWLGSRPGEVRQAEDLVAPLARYAVLGQAMIDQLRADRAAGLDRAPSTLQRERLKALRGE